ncbi:hypothetical protein LOC100571457 [Anopheles sinensis]|uniref:Uncharacterized protein n=1 Tax=Anopheles sinensis TaxID=74873 RepID=A0A084WQ42_ANOSI|nr:hypothetical protein LOC100571457 [Anopheles sinensis]
MRKSLSAKEKLIVTLRYLATDNNYKTLEHTFRKYAIALLKLSPTEAKPPTRRIASRSIGN